MKKNVIAATVLALLLIMLCFCSSCGAESLHLLLDIPFEISVDECRQLLNEKYGYVLAEHPRYATEEYQSYALAEPDSVDMFGLPVFVLFSFVDNRLDSVGGGHLIGTATDDIDTFLSDSLDLFFSFIETVEAFYGVADDGRIDDLSINERGEGRGRGYYDYPIHEGIRDKDTMKEIFVDLKDPLKITAFAEVYGNLMIMLRRGCHYPKNGVAVWSTIISMNYERDPQIILNALGGGTEPFMGRDGTYPGLL